MSALGARSRDNHAPRRRGGGNARQNPSKERCPRGAPGLESGMKIYTKTGDDGQTGLFGGERTLKNDARVEAYGSVDETNACLGVARAAGVSPDIDATLE